MYRKENLILTYAAGDEEVYFAEDSGFWRFINSIDKLHLQETTNIIVFTHDMSGLVRDELDSLGIGIKRIPKEQMAFISRDRHHAYWKWLLDHHKAKYVGVFDSRDVIFQANPWEWIEEWKVRYNDITGPHSFLNNFVILTSEGMKLSSSGWNCIEQMEFQRDIPDPFKKDNREDRWVVNGGVALGTPDTLREHHFLMWMTTLKSVGRITDQASLNYLFYYLEEDERYCLSDPTRDYLCLTGEGVKEGFVDKPILKDGLWCNPNLEDKPPYCIIHQWDRVHFLKEHVEKTF